MDRTAATQSDENNGKNDVYNDKNDIGNESLNNRLKTGEVRPFMDIAKNRKRKRNIYFNDADGKKLRRDTGAQYPHQTGNQLWFQ